MTTPRATSPALRSPRHFAIEVGVALALSLALGGLSGCAMSTDEDGDEQSVVLDEAAQWNAAYDEQTGGKADSVECSGMVVPDRSGFGKRVALTFDDGPNATTTPRVLDILKAHGIKGTFFTNGSRLGTAEARQLIARMVAEGHNVGNHSQTHQNLKTVSAAKLEQEISQTQNILAGLGVEPGFFRFPFGSAGCYAAEQVREHGYKIVGWHIDSADWCFASGHGTCPASTFRYVDDQYRSNMAGFVLSQARANGGGILLFHDIHPNTVDHLESIITTLLDDGFTFVGVDDEQTFPLLNGVTAPFVGSSCSGPADCSFSAGGAQGECLTYGDQDQQGICTVDCQGYCPDKSGFAPTFCTSLDGGQTGQCLPKSDALNHACADLPGTVAVSVPRFVGTSTASAATAVVCIPE